MRYLLDTNVCARYLNGRSMSIRNRFRSTSVSEMAVCSIVKTELFYGAMRSNNPTRTLERQQEFLEQFVSLPFGDNAAIICAEMRSRLAVAGTPVGAYDLQIAAIALVHNLILVTHNTREFDRIDGLQIEDWEAEV